MSVWDDWGIRVLNKPISKNDFLNIDIKTLDIKSNVTEEILKQPKFLLTTPFTCQVQSFTDITTCSTNNNDFNNESMILLNLTDSNFNIQALEMSPCLNVRKALYPGNKVLFKASAKKPIVIRKGILLMYECNVEKLGGTVIEMKNEYLEKKRIQQHRLSLHTSCDVPKFIPFTSKTQKNSVKLSLSLPIDNPIPENAPREKKMKSKLNVSITQEKKVLKNKKKNKKNQAADKDRYDNYVEGKLDNEQQSYIKKNNVASIDSFIKKN